MTRANLGASDPDSGEELAPATAEGLTPRTVPRSGLGRASALLASGTLVSRILGFVRGIVLVATIGQVGSVAGDAFGIANQLPNNVYALIAGGVLSAVLVPQIVRASAHDDGGTRYINKIITLGITVFLAIAVLVTVAAPLVVSLYAAQSEVGRGFTPAGLALITAFAYWCLPQLLFYAIYSLLGEVLNARKAFGAFSWAPVANNVVSLGGLIVFLVLFGGKDINSDVAVWDVGRIAILAGSSTFAVAVQALVLVAFWKRAGLTFRPDFRWRGVGLGRTGKIAGWTFGMIAVTQVAGVFQVRALSTSAGLGASVATLQNSWLLFMLPHSVIAVSVATAYFTRMSGHASRNDLAAVRHDVFSSLRTINLFMTFASVALVVVAFPFARIYESDFAKVESMAPIIIAFVIALVPFSAVFVLQRVFFSLEDTRTPFLVETVKAGLFIVGALLCARLPVGSIGVAIALLTSVVCAVQAGLTFWLLRRKLGSFGGRGLLLHQLQYLLAAGIAAVAGVSILVATGGLRSAGFAQSGVTQSVGMIVLIGAAMAVSYLAMLLLLRNPDARAVLSAVGGRLRRTR